MPESATSIAERVLAAAEDEFDTVRIREFTDDDSARDKQSVKELYADFGADFERAESELCESFGPPSRTGEGGNDLIPLNGVYRYTFWEVGDRQLYLAIAHEDLAPMFSVELPGQAEAIPAAGCPILLVVGAAHARAMKQQPADSEGTSVELKYDIIPDNAPSFAADAVSSALKVSGVRLDYSVESLAQVDEIIEGFRADGCTSSDVLATLFGFGCYVGEVFVRHAGFEWEAAEPEDMEKYGLSPLVIRGADNLVVNPIGKTIKRMDEGTEHSLPYFYEKFAHPSEG